MLRLALFPLALLLTLATGRLAAADDATIWVIARTGRPYPPSQIVPLGMLPYHAQQDPDHFHIRPNGDHPRGLDLERDENGGWVDARTGQPYPTDKLVPLGMKWSDYLRDPDHYRTGPSDRYPHGVDLFRVPRPDEPKGDAVAEAPARAPRKLSPSRMSDTRHRSAIKSPDEASPTEETAAVAPSPHQPSRVNQPASQPDSAVTAAEPPPSAPGPQSQGRTPAATPKRESGADGRELVLIESPDHPQEVEAASVRTAKSAPEPDAPPSGVSPPATTAPGTSGPRQELATASAALSAVDESEPGLADAWEMSVASDTASRGSPKTGPGARPPGSPAHGR